MDSFYLTLPSNLSSNVYPDNKQSQYTTRLPRVIELDGEYEVALAQIQYSPVIEFNYGTFKISDDSFKDTLPQKNIDIVSKNGLTIKELVVELISNINIIWKTTQAYKTYKTLRDNLDTNRISTNFTDLKALLYDHIIKEKDYNDITRLNVIERHTKDKDGKITEKEFVLLCEPDDFTTKDSFSEKIFNLLKKITIDANSRTKLKNGIVLLKEDIKKFDIDSVKLNVISILDNTIFSIIDDFDLDDYQTNFEKNKDLLNLYPNLFKITQVRNKFTIEKIDKENTTQCQVNGELAVILSQFIKKTVSEIYIFDTTTNFKLKQIFFTPIKYAFLYCDVISDQFVGDVASKILSVIPVEQQTTNNQEIVTHYDNLHYVPVQLKYFSTINISLRDARGDLIRFADLFSATIVKLHFRRRHQIK